MEGCDYKSRSYWTLYAKEFYLILFLFLNEPRTSVQINTVIVCRQRLRARFWLNWKERDGIYSAETESSSIQGLHKKKQKITGRMTDKKKKNKNGEYGKGENKNTEKKM